MNIDFNGAKNFIISAYQTASAKVVEWSGRGVAVLKSGTEIALPYLQDKRIAVVSLIAVNLILVEVGNLFGRLLTCWVPNETNGQKRFREIVHPIIGIAIQAAGVTAFSKYAKLPLGWLAIAITTVATVLLRAQCSQIVKEEPVSDGKAEIPKEKSEKEKPIKEKPVKEKPVKEKAAEVKLAEVKV